MSQAATTTSRAAAPEAAEPARAPVGTPVRVSLAVAGLAVLIGVILLRPGGTEAADDTEHVVPVGVVGPLQAGDRVRQTFTADDDGLRTISVRPNAVGTGCTVVARLLDDGDAEVASRSVDCGSIDAGGLLDVIDSPPIAATGGREYTLELSVTGDGAVLLTAGPDDDGRLPAATGAAVSAGGDGLPIELHSDYGDDPRAAGQLGTALDRISLARPSWQQPVPLVLTVLAALGALGALVVVRGRAAVALVVLFVIAKGLVWTAILPPFQAPDEPAHFAYAQFLAEEHALPRRDTATINQPGLYSPQVHALDHLVHINAAAEGDRPDYSPAAVAAFEDLAELSSESGDPRGNGAAAGYPPAYYVPGAVLYAIGPERVDHSVQFVRWSSIGFGVMLALAALAAGRRLFGAVNGSALALAVAVSAQPMISQQTATVNNDAMVIAAAAWALVAGLELSRPIPERWPRLAFWAAFAVGLSLLAKTFGAAMGPVVLVGWLIGRLRTPKDDRYPLWREAALAAAGLLVTFGLWTAIASLRGFQGAALADFDEDATPLSFLDYVHTLRLDRFALVRHNLVDQLWGDFGWLRVPLPVGVQHVIGWSLAAVVVLTIVWVVLRAVDVVTRWRRHRWEGFDLDNTAAGALLIGAVTGTLVLLFTVQYQIFHDSGGLYILQGRYFLVGVLALLALPTVVVQSLAPRVPTAVPAVAVAVAVAMVTLNVISVAVVVEHFYL